MQNTNGPSNVITFLPPLTFNEHFLRAFTGEDAPCAALGIVETAGKEKGFIALKTEREISNQQSGFNLGAISGKKWTHLSVFWDPVRSCWLRKISRRCCRPYGLPEPAP